MYSQRCAVSLSPCPCIHKHTHFLVAFTISFFHAIESNTCGGSMYKYNAMASIATMRRGRANESILFNKICFCPCRRTFIHFSFFVFRVGDECLSVSFTHTRRLGLSYLSSFHAYYYAEVVFRIFSLLFSWILHATNLYHSALVEYFCIYTHRYRKARHIFHSFLSSFIYTFSNSTLSLWRRRLCFSCCWCSSDFCSIFLWHADKSVLKCGCAMNAGWLEREEENRMIAFHMWSSKTNVWKTWRSIWMGRKTINKCVHVWVWVNAERLGEWLMSFSSTYTHPTEQSAAFNVDDRPIHGIRRMRRNGKRFLLYICCIVHSSMFQCDGYAYRRYPYECHVAPNTSGERRVCLFNSIIIYSHRIGIGKAVDADLCQHEQTKWTKWKSRATSSMTTVSSNSIIFTDYYVNSLVRCIPHYNCIQHLHSPHCYVFHLLYT